MTIDFDFRERPKPASSQRRPVAVTALQPGPRRDVGDGSMLATPPEPQEHNSVWVDLDIRVVAGAAAIVIAKLFLLGLLLHSVWS